MKKTKQQGDEEDMLSALPDSLLIRILSLLDTRYAVQTSVLSQRWVGLWTSVYNLSLNSNLFKKVYTFYYFVDHVIARRDSNVKVQTVSFIRNEIVSFELFFKVISYAISQSVQHLDIFIEHIQLDCFPFHASDSIRTLKLGLHVGSYGKLETPLCFEKLTTLHLKEVTFVEPDPFLSCPNLRDLELETCRFIKLHEFYISAPKLTRLAISFFDFDELNSDTLILSTPILSSFHSIGFTSLVTVDDILFLDNVSIGLGEKWLYKDEDKVSTDLISMLSCLRYVKSLTLSMRVVEYLSWASHKLANESSPFANLKLLKFKSDWKCRTLNIPAHVITYFIGNATGTNIVMEFPRCKHCKPESCSGWLGLYCSYCSFVDSHINDNWTR